MIQVLYCFVLRIYLRKDFSYDVLEFLEQDKGIL